MMWCYCVLLYVAREAGQVLAASRTDEGQHCHQYPCKNALPKGFLEKSNLLYNHEYKSLGLLY